MKTVIAVLLAICALPVLAQSSACDHPKNDFDGLYCLNKIWIEADHNLNQAYQKLNAKLNAEGKTSLKKGQLAWIESRNASCSKTDSSGFFVNLKCATDTTIERTRFLEDRYRECVSAGCMNSRL
ncbi:MAG TPA: lysozyme inhibitor LprI family protein [Candidatus Angelobacter sp.]